MQYADVLCQNLYRTIHRRYEYLMHRPTPTLNSCPTTSNRILAPKELKHIHITAVKSIYFHTPLYSLLHLVARVTRGREGWGRTVPCDTLQGVTPELHFLKMWLNSERTVDKRGRTAKKVITVQTAMSKKCRQFFRKK